MNKKKRYTMPPISWLKVTDFMHGWVNYELGGSARIKDKCVISTQHLRGAREILRMETVEDTIEKKTIDKSLSATRYNCIMAGLEIDAEVMEQDYGATTELMDLFIPIECPRCRLATNGVLRPWTPNVCFSKEQASELQRLLRDEFWRAVEEYDCKYRKNAEGRKYPAIEMIEGFCKLTNTSDIYAQPIRREWQRRIARTEVKP